MVPFENSVELIRNSGLPESALIETGKDHRLADPEPLEMILRACGRLSGSEPVFETARNDVVDYSDDQIEDAARIQQRIRQKLLAIIDLQGDIDELIRDSPPSPFRAANFTNARPEELQRMALIAATQFVLFEPKDWVEGNDRFRSLAEDLLDHVIKQVEWVKGKYR